MEYPCIVGKPFSESLGPNPSPGRLFWKDYQTDSICSLREIIELGDENASFVAQELRNDIAADLGGFLSKGLRLRSIDRKATTAAQDRAILEMEPTVISVQEGEIILGVETG